MKIKRVFKFACVALLVSALGACGGIHKQAFNKDAHQDVKTVGLLEPASNGEYSVLNHGHVGGGFGLIGGLIAVADMQSENYSVHRFNERAQIQSCRGIPKCIERGTSECRLHDEDDKAEPGEACFLGKLR